MKKTMDRPLQRLHGGKGLLHSPVPLRRRNWNFGLLPLLYPWRGRPGRPRWAETAQVTVTPSPSLSPSPTVDAVKPTIPATPSPTPYALIRPRPQRPPPPPPPRPSEVVTSSVYTWPVKGDGTQFLLPLTSRSSAPPWETGGPTMEWTSPLTWAFRSRPPPAALSPPLSRTIFMGTTVTIDHGNGMVRRILQSGRAPHRGGGRCGHHRRYYRLGGQYRKVREPHRLPPPSGDDEGTGPMWTRWSICRT